MAGLLQDLLAIDVKQLCEDATKARKLAQLESKLKLLLTEVTSTQEKEAQLPKKDVYTNSVFIRVRPLTADEQAANVDLLEGLTLQSTLSNGTSAVALSRPKERPQVSGFRGIFGPEANNAAVYKAVLSQKLAVVLSGGLFSLFCYGYTGSGKTHTVLGYGDDKGLYHLAATQLLKTLKQAEQKESSKLLQVSCAEIYLDRVYDLLDSAHSEVTLRVDEKGELNVRAKTELNEETGAVSTKGLKTELISSVEMLESLMQIAVSRRAVGTSTTHSRSSRSHAILRMEVVNEQLVDARAEFERQASMLPVFKNAVDDHQKATFGLLHDYTPATGLTKKPPPEGMDATEWNIQWFRLEAERQTQLELLIRERDDYIALVDATKTIADSIVEKDDELGGALLFIDLAGADNDSRDLSNEHSAQQRTESTAINKSLLALKECIRGLVGKDTSIPFRNSKLTRVLEPVLRPPRSNSESVMLVNVSPGKHLEKNTLNTLRYGQLVAEAAVKKPQCSRK